MVYLLDASTARAGIDVRFLRKKIHPEGPKAVS
jgi:hypothetical protein